ncbi:hypothetical protein U1Q18_052146 [Sarracenia purpurea var. burkii]
MVEDGQSSSTSTTPNSSSSYEYSHEPYETFQSKVISLAHSLDDVDDIALQRTVEGATIVSLSSSCGKGEHSVTGVFRIPRFPNLSLERDEDDAGTTRQIDREIQDQAAVLQFLASRDLSAPKLLAFDASAANAIGSPFVFQEYSWVYRCTMSIEDRGSPGQLPVSILYHWDLEPRNILVRPKNGLESEHAQETGEWEIDKVIDWDRILAVPPVLARKPPVWLWDFSYDSEHPSIPSDFDGDVDHFTPSRYDIDSGRLSPDDQRIRQHFEENLILGLRNHYEGYDRASYLEEAYGKGRWLRRLARFAIHGASDNQDLERFHAFDRSGPRYMLRRFRF